MLDMEGHLPISPELEHSFDNADDEKYISRLSTILVATIQETKDRISQIEYIFCSQLFPNFQSQSKSRLRVYSDAQKAAENEWKKKEDDLLFQLGRLQCEKQKVVDENNALQMEKVKLSKERKEDINIEVKQLERLLRTKSLEIDEQVELQKELIQVIQTKSSKIAEMDRSLEERDKELNTFVVKLESLEKKVNELEGELLNKTEEIIRDKELQENLVAKIESKHLMVNNEVQLIDHGNNKKLLETMVDNLLKEFKKKTEEADEKGKSFKHLFNGTVLNKQQLGEQKKEEKLILTRQNFFGEIDDDFQVRKGDDDTAKGKQAYEKLLQQAKLRDQELQSERKKYKQLIASFKSLKSQHNYLRKKMGLTAETMLSSNTIDVAESDSLKHHQNSTILPGQEMKTKCPSSDASGSKSPTIPKDHKIKTNQTPDKNPAQYSGTKRRASQWRHTRAQRPNNGRDPHDDFLDTPFEKIKENKNTKEILDDLNRDKEEEEEGEGDDLENPNPQKRGGGHKYVEVVRKKSDRENLKGVECRQCKKFYDAVLVDDGNKTRQCEHHDGVSRHRYRYVPPSTPEGFWNIGFDTEI